MFNFVLTYFIDYKHLSAAIVTVANTIFINSVINQFKFSFLEISLVL